MAAIEVRGVHKTFRLPHERHTTLAERALSLFRPPRYERFEALRGVDLNIEPGTFMGLIGRNGSGKSTLLKIIAGILEPDAGTVQVHGSVSALIELGLGFSAELTVCENVELYAALLGCRWQDTAVWVEQAIAFAELERFRDAKLKNLSTGMRMRLAFATALQGDGDVYLLDEILAVGDAQFQQKCLDVFRDLKSRRKTIVLVSHNLAHLQELCDDAALLEDGRITVRGTPDTVIGRYLDAVGQGLPAATPQTAPVGDGAVRVVDGWVEGEDGQRSSFVRSGERVTLVLVARVEAGAAAVVFGFILKDAGGADVFVINSQQLGAAPLDLAAGQCFEIRMPFTAALCNGTYTVHAVSAHRSGHPVHEWLVDAVKFVVWGSRCPTGVIDLQAGFDWRPSPAAEVAPAAGRRSAG